ncbi:methionyl-tRNA formyltransferase [Salipaludibacillus aurantiacus]|uniref:Methionyl-tRNA formyltransferase n=1 Tax=Salipaludibacillus aurantiacus TaxID=1601833 RepID=A0A1H9QPV4_9BACI|nr:methionyl-tRNA formyltransferase [Salipaludibacillus aurantiacus]SER62621.1 methionyl-tRNA formyltransferase [Salipaludibacillus aurantiacus]
MKIVFMGTPDFAVPVLESVVNNGYDVSLVVTQPDRPKGRKQTLTPPPVKVAAEKMGLPVFQPEKIKNETEWKQVEKINPDLIITAAFGQILPQELLDVPPKGCINVHASLLPKYRGGAPIHQAVIDGEEKTGITIMYMVAKLDAGDMIAQESLPILPEDTTGTMHDKLSRLGAELLTRTLPLIEKGDIHPVRQDEEYVTYAPNIKKEQERIDWAKTADQLFNQIRGLNPWPVAHTEAEGKRFKVWEAETSQDHTDESPGTVVAIEEHDIKVACGDGKTLALTKVQPAGKKPMDVATFLRGAGSNWEPGMKLGE